MRTDLRSWAPWLRKCGAGVACIANLTTASVKAGDLASNEQAMAVAYEHVINSQGLARKGQSYCLTTGGVLRAVAKEREAAGFAEVRAWSQYAYTVLHPSLGPL